jgi:hypothetical protein
MISLQKDVLLESRLKTKVALPSAKGQNVAIPDMDISHLTLLLVGL